MLPQRNHASHRCSSWPNVANKIHYKLKRSQALKARLQNSKHTSAKQLLNADSVFQRHMFGVSVKAVKQYYIIIIQCETVSQKNPLPPRGPDIFHFVHKRLRIFYRFLHNYYTFLSTLHYKFLFNYPRFWRSYAILSATTTSSHNMRKMSKTRAFRRLHKSFIALLIVVCG